VGLLLREESFQSFIYERCARLAWEHEDPFRHLPRFARSVSAAAVWVLRLSRKPLPWSAVPAEMKTAPGVARAWVDSQKPIDAAVLYEFSKIVQGNPVGAEDFRKHALSALRKEPWLFSRCWGEFDRLKEDPRIRGTAVEGFAERLSEDSSLVPLVPRAFHREEALVSLVGGFPVPMPQG
jgi:hypothetical protein